MQEEAQRNTEKCFIVLPVRLAIIRNPAKFWKDKDLDVIMTTGIVLLNKINDNKPDDDVKAINNSF